MKRKFATGIIYLLLCFTPVFAKTIRLGYFSESGMMNGAAEGEKKSGYAYDYLQEIAGNTGWKYEYVYGSFSDLYEKLLTNEIDMLPYLTKTEARTHEILFPEQPMGEEQFYIASLNPGYLSENLSELNGKKIGTIKNAFQNNPFRKLIQQKGITCELVEYPLIDEQWEALKKGEIDYTIETSTIYQGVQLHAVAEFGERYPYYLTVAKGREDLIDELQTAHRNIQNINPGFLENLKYKYFVGIPLFNEIPVEALKWLNNHTKIVVGTYDNDSPYVIQNDDGTFCGIACDQINLMLNSLGVTIPVEWKLYPGRKQALEALYGGEIDCINPYYHNYDDSEKDGLIISHTVYSSDFSVLYKGAYTDDTLKKIATPDTRLGAQYVRDNYPDAIIVPCQNGYDCIQKLEAGQANCVVMYTDALQEIAKDYRKQHYLKNLTADCEVCFAALPEDSALITLINKAIPFVSEVEKGVIQNKYSIENKSLSAGDYLLTHPESLWGTVAGILAIALAFVIWFTRREKKYAANEAETEFYKNVITQFTSDYEAVISGNLNDGSYKILSHNPDIDKVFTGKNTMVDAIEQFINRGVYSADRERIDNSMIHFEEIRQKLPLGKSDMLVYRNTKGNGYIWYSAYMTRISEDYVIIGFKQCDEEITTRQITEKLIEDYDALYMVDLDHDEVRTIKAGNVSSVGVFKDKAVYSKKLAKYATIVAPRYKQDWLNFGNIEYLKEYMSKEDHREYVYELPENEGSMCRFSVDVIDRIDGEASSVLLSFISIDDGRAQKIMLTRQLADQKVLLDYFVDSYSSAYFVNLADDTFEIIHMDHEFSQVFANKERTRESMLKFIDDHIHPDDKPVMLQHIDKKYIKNLLKKETSVSFVVREEFDGIEKIMRALIVRGTDTDHIAVGFMDITEEMKEEKETHAKMEEALTFTNFFLDTYLSAYYVNLKTLEWQVYKRTEKLERDYPIGDNYVDSLLDYINRDVHPDDRDALIAVTKPEKMQQLLGNHKEYSHIFRDISDGVEKVYKMQVICGTDRDHAAYGFMDITEEVRAQKKQFLGTVSLSKDILDKANVGLWAFELDEGLPPRMYVDDTMLGLIGLEHQVSPEETYHAWYDHIDKDSYDLVAEAVEKMGNGEHAEVQYPWHHPDGHTLIVRCGGVQNPDYVAGIRIEGTHQNVTEVLHYDEKEVERFKRTAIQLQHEQLRSEVLNYMVNHNDDDPIELLKNFAEQLRSLIECDQVIYRDLEETRIMVNSEGIANTWSVPIEYCQQCAHFDAHHKMYRNGYTEMSNCQEGWEGIPVYHKCPIKSSLTRIVYCDGEVAGYLAIHYVQDYHRFTDIERNTLEEFARILSMSLSRYEARKSNKEKKRYDILHEIIHSGKWSFFVNKNDEIIKSEYSDEVKRIVNNDLSNTITSWTDVIHPDDKEATLKAFNATIVDHSGNTPYDVTFRMADRNNDYHWFHSAGRIVRDENGNGEFFGIHIDISEQINEQLKQQHQLEEALSMAQSANRAKTTFLNNMSHDIRTPMNAIMGFTELAEKHINEKEIIQDYLSKISQSSTHLLSLINDVLDMSRIESGKMFISEQEENLSEIISALQNIVQADVKAKNLNFTINTKKLKNPNIFCDKLRLNQILLNVISNSIKYTEKGGNILLTVTEEKSEKELSAYKFCIKDNGIGMSEEFLKTIFDPFTRVKSSTVSGIQGTGLGMSITKNLVDMMDGKIEINSKEGEGTEVIMTFNFKQQGSAAEDSEKNKKIQKKSKDKVELTGKKILLVDDNEYNREIAVEVLKENKVVVTVASDGVEAVEKIKNAKKGDYDLVLMDIQMPVLNGYEATKQIRALGTEVSKIPILAMTANAFEEDRKLALEAGMNDHISKPVRIDVLQDALKKFLP